MEILYVFKWNKTSKLYCLYTDNTYESDKLNIYGATIDPDGSLQKINTTEEWEEVEKELEIWMNKKAI